MDLGTEVPGADADADAEFQYDNFRTILGLPRPNYPKAVYSTS